MTDISLCDSATPSRGKSSLHRLLPPPKWHKSEETAGALGKKRVTADRPQMLGCRREPEVQASSVERRKGPRHSWQPLSTGRLARNVRHAAFMNFFGPKYRPSQRRDQVPSTSSRKQHHYHHLRTGLFIGYLHTSNRTYSLAQPSRPCSVCFPLWCSSSSHASCDFAYAVFPSATATFSDQVLPATCIRVA